MPSGRSNLENLVRARQLNTEPADEREIANLLAAAERQLRDARNTALSADSSFTLAYNAAHSLALAALRSQGFRPSSTGHRRLLFQTLEFTAGAPAKLAAALGNYHDRRNKVEYQGSLPSGTEARDLIEVAAELQALLSKRLKPRK